MTLTFDQFKSYFEFTLEVGGVFTAGIGYMYRATILKAIYKVAAGHASPHERRAAVDAVNSAGQQGDTALSNLQHQLQNLGQEDEARRLEALRPQQAEPSSPGQIV